MCRFYGLGALGNTSTVFFALVLSLAFLYYIQYEYYELETLVFDAGALELGSYYRTLAACAQHFKELDCNAAEGKFVYSPIRADICQMYAQCMMSPVQPLKVAVWWKYFRALMWTWNFIWRVLLGLVFSLCWKYTIDKARRGLFQEQEHVLTKKKPVNNAPVMQITGREAGGTDASALLVESSEEESSDKVDSPSRQARTRGPFNGRKARVTVSSH